MEGSVLWEERDEIRETMGRLYECGFVGVVKGIEVVIVVPGVLVKDLGRDAASDPPRGWHCFGTHSMTYSTC